MENDLFAFLSLFLGEGLGNRDKIRCSFWAYWQARSGLPISVRPNWTFFSL